MRNGRRLTAVGMLTGGLLLVGFAAPSLADDNLTSSTPDAAVVKVDPIQPEESFIQSADEGSSSKNAVIVEPARTEGVVALLSDGQECDPVTDANCNESGQCVPKDYNGILLGCGEDPDACPPGQNDYNGDVAGCGEDPDACPIGQVDFNGTDPGCGEDPDSCPSDQVDSNGTGPGCGDNPIDTCPEGQTDQNGPLPNGCASSENNETPSGPAPQQPGTTRPPRNPGPVTSAGGASGGNGSGAEGTVPGASTGSTVPGTTACGDPAICTATIQGVDATTVTVPAASGTAAALPDTGAPASSQGLLVVGFGLLGAGALLVRPRRLARHRA